MIKPDSDGFYHVGYGVGALIKPTFYSLIKPDLHLQIIWQAQFGENKGSYKATIVYFDKSCQSWFIHLTSDEERLQINDQEWSYIYPIFSRFVFEYPETIHQAFSTYLEKEAHEYVEALLKHRFTPLDIFVKDVANVDVDRPLP